MNQEMDFLFPELAPDQSSSGWDYYSVFDDKSLKVMNLVAPEFGITVEILVKEGYYTPVKGLSHDKMGRLRLLKLREGEVFGRLHQPSPLQDLSPFWKKVDELKKAAKLK